jgi:OmpA-OmpF porin, OOP family
MKKNLTSIVACTLLVCVALTLAYGKDDTKLKGMIIARTADNMTVRAADGTTTVVVLTDETKVQQPKGLGLRKTQMSWTSLIPGLPVSVSGDTNTQGQVVASTVTFTKQSLATANMIQAGLTPTNKEVQANQQNIATNKQDIASNQQQIATNQQEVSQRFADLADYDVKTESVVYFAVGRSQITEKDKAALASLAANAVRLPGYMIEVKGFADSTGNAALNQALSKERAEEVTAYLMQVGNISPRHIMAPGAMGIADPVASNESAQGRADNRRVEVKVLVNRGVNENAGR